ncbi:hypothetical protein IQ273_12835 [Nodosilinea sp. LEGE 07298]|uniref:hypothetical protein n=1 Tax=Nodosilinea sp. LEGE 07298 TaxID=2777970 RepID=UPI001881D640|nr:hypothetical protein [Nodosilinea sp. LEGE 07298]MBE9110298.1 hypothetical protein [Nodosilinea sp. LEGE 07298]
MTTSEDNSQSETTQSEPVTLEQITALLTGFKTEVLTEVNTANAGAVAATKKLLQKVTDAPQAPAADSSADSTDDAGGQKLTLKALQTEIADLKAERERERQETLEAKRNSAVTQAIAGSGALNQKVLYRLFLSDNGEKIQQEGDQWFLKNGDDDVAPLDAALTKFLSSEEGKFFLPPSGVNGAGSTETKSTTAPAKTTYNSRLEQMTAELQSGEAKLAL